MTSDVFCTAAAQRLRLAVDMSHGSNEVIRKLWWKVETGQKAGRRLDNGPIQAFLPLGL